MRSRADSPTSQKSGTSTLKRILNNNGNNNHKTDDVKIPSVSITPVTPEQKPSPQQSPVPNSDSRIDESSLLDRHCKDSEFYKDLSLIQKANHYTKFDFTLDDMTLSEEDMTPTRDSTHELSYQAEKAANMFLMVSQL